MPLSKKETILKTFSSLSNQDDRFRELIKIGRNTSPYPEEFRTKDFLVEGCLSQLWLHPRFIDGKVQFEIDSDAAIPKGIAAILIEILGGCTPSEILDFDATFLREVGIDQHLSMNRRNGMSNLMKQIKLYAYAFKAMN